MSLGLILLVSGSRDWPAEHRHVVEQAIRDALSGDSGTKALLVHGACPTGADAIADEFWRTLSGVLPARAFSADWDAYGKAAGPYRNAEMVKFVATQARESGAKAKCLFFPWGRSVGTRGTIRSAEAASLRVIKFEGKDLIGEEPPRERTRRWTSASGGRWVR